MRTLETGQEKTKTKQKHWNRRDQMRRKRVEMRPDDMR